MKLLLDEPHLLDTSAAILLMRRNMVAAPEAMVPFVALAELLVGVERTTDPTRERVHLQVSIGASPIIYPNPQTLISYSRTAASLSKIGRSIPTNDIWNAALALQWNLPLLANDAHFSRVPRLRFVSVR